jgi:phosphatidylserine/phosphatidylglycerophosphate/cardiolipin synthase-like enzyme
VRRGVLSLAGLETLRAAGFELRSVPNLHVKAAIVDTDWGLAGSGNLTVSGLAAHSNGNVELGIVLVLTAATAPLGSHMAAVRAAALRRQFPGLDQRVFFIAVDHVSADQYAGRRARAVV